MSVRRLIAEMDTGTVNVTEFCVRHGLGRSQFYEIRRQFAAGGESALVPGSRAPLHVANKTPAAVEDTIVSLRKELVDSGLDAGAATIRWHLDHQGVEVPSVSTIYRILVRRGFVVSNPKKKPKTPRSFAAERANAVWQIDGTFWALTETLVVKIINIIDDCSRTNIASRVHDGETFDAAWDAVTTGAQTWGLPERILSDNGSAFKALNTAMGQIGIGYGHSTPYHPQTCGKVERFHQTQKNWLAKQPCAKSKEELQNQLDRFSQIYNNERPHNGIGRCIPSDVWHQTPKSGPVNSPLTERPTEIKRGIINKRSVIWGASKSITLPRGYAGEPFTLIVTNTTAHVFVNGELVRNLELDPHQRDHPFHPRTGRPN